MEQIYTQQLHREFDARYNRYVNTYHETTCIPNT